MRYATSRATNEFKAGQCSRLSAQELFEKYDDGDGALSPEEFEKLKASQVSGFRAFRAVWLTGPGCQFRPGWFWRGSDIRTGRKQQAAFCPDLAWGLPRNSVAGRWFYYQVSFSLGRTTGPLVSSAQLDFGKLDADGDGVVTQEELASALAQPAFGLLGLGL